MSATSTNVQIEERRKPGPSRLPEGICERRGWRLPYGPERRAYQSKWADPRWFERYGEQYGGPVNA